jgi:hypothetical protein
MMTASAPNSSLTIRIAWRISGAKNRLIFII